MFSDFARAERLPMPLAAYWSEVSRGGLLCRPRFAADGRTAEAGGVFDRLEWVTERVFVSNA